MTTHSGLTFHTLTATDEGDLLDGWFQAMRRGFHEGRAPKAAREVWLDHVRTNEVTLRGAWQDAPPLVPTSMPIATFSSWDQEINVGDGTLPLHLISDVTVAPTHRRRGLLRTLMTADLDDAVAAGVPLAALTVSEGSIYGRFGFGMATRVRDVEVDLGPRFRLRDTLGEDGTVTLLEPAEAWPTVAAIFEATLRTTRGAVARPQFYETWLASRLDFESHQEEVAQRTAVHLDSTGTPDGYAVYKVAQEAGFRQQHVRIVDLQATRPEAYLALWRYLASLDLVEVAYWGKAPISDPLPWALTDPLCVRRASVKDLLWLRVLDLVAAWQARPWGADDALVVAVTDAMGYIDGRWRITTRDGAAGVVTGEGEPHVSMSAEAVGALYLGDVDVPTLAAAGWISGTPDAVRRFAAMADVGGAPYCSTGF